MPIATNAQIRELANTIALQADALAQGKISDDVLYAHIRLLAENTRTLEVWTDDLKPLPVSQNRAVTVKVSGVLDAIDQADLDAIESRPSVLEPGAAADPRS